MQHLSRLALYLLFIFVLSICLQYQTIQAVNTCWGYSATDTFNVCGGHGFCQGSNSCYCVDSTTSNTLYSSGGSNTLYQQNSLWSTNNQYELKQQNDGNLVLYTKTGSVLWSADTWQQTQSQPYTFVLVSDGTLQVKNGGGSVVKTLTSSCGVTLPVRLVVQNDGNVVLYGAQKEVCWASGSNQGGSSLTYNWAGDQCNQNICYGLTGSSACSGHGSCNSKDSCSCYNGYGGTQCTDYYCNNIIYSQTGTVCNGRGTCNGPNTCQCTGGYEGTFCDSYKCNGLVFNDPNVCSGFGTCSSPDSCTNCLAGRYGSQCQYFDCGGIRFDQPNVCSGRGECGSKNNCTCSEPYFGNNCENYLCNGIINNSSMVCSGHGSCSSPENCTCQEGYFGENCELFECSGILKNESNVCNSFGNCTASETCQCDEQHTGKYCEINICNGVLSNSASVCSSHGQCYSSNNCTCDENYSGKNCEIYDCYGAVKNSSTACSGRGTCAAYNNCTCLAPFYGNDCGLYNCFGVEHLNESTCSSHGSCDSPNNCTCQQGYYGGNCEAHQCYGTLFNRSTVCSTHGQCLSPNNCLCEAGYYGPDCSEHDCFGVNKNSSDVCFKHGTCLSPNNCSCQTGYFSFDCSNHECYGNLFNDTMNICSGHGSCPTPNNCTCKQGYYGNNCELYKCYGTLFNSSNVCSTHGQCLSPNTCLCEAGYYNTDCSEHDCFGVNKNSSDVCFKHGTCLGPNNCSCQEGYFAFDCSNHECYGYLFNDTMNVCSGHGSCPTPNNCTCQQGYYGNNCEAHQCYGTLFNSSSVCSNHGQCLSPNNCSCEAGYYGPACSEHDCFGVHKNSSNVCFKHGTCMSPNNCSCTDGYFSFDCSNHNCFGTLFNDSSVCSGHGSCFVPDNCTCQLGYYGQTCELHKCYGTLFNNSNVCSTHGQCLSPDTCLCEAGYYGPDCSEHDCFGVHKNSSNVCFKHGTCSSPNNCSCQEGYFSFDCSNHNCFGILFNDTSVCSNYGSCYLPDNCTCQLGYYGQTCEMYNCYGTIFNDSTTCSGKGLCLSPNNCSCVEGFTSKDCSVNISPFQINLTKYEEVVYLEFDNKTISIEIQLIDPMLSQTPNVSFIWTCIECDGQNVVYYVNSNRLFINSTLTDVTQAGNYTFIANSSIANIEPFKSRKSNIQQFKLIVKYDLNQPTLGSFGLPSVLVSGTQDQTISTVINSITLNQTTLRYFLGCGKNCSTLVSYFWEVKAGVFSYQKSGSVLAKYESSNLMSFSPSVPIQATIPSDYLNETVSFTFTVVNGKQQNISSSVHIQIISSASPPKRVSNLVNVAPISGISMNDKFTIKISEWVALPELLPLKYAFGYFDKAKAQAIRLTEYSLNTTFSSYLPYIRTSTKTRNILETKETIGLVVFVQDSLGNVETETAANVTVSPFNGTQEQYIEVVKSLSGESLLVASVDQTFTASTTSPSLVSALISNVVIDPKNPSSSLSSLETLTSNNETLTADTVSQVINKLDTFVSNLTDLYLSEIALYGYVKSGLSNADVTKTVQVISNCFSTSYDAEKTKSTASLITTLVYYGTIPTVVDTSAAELPTTSFKSTAVNITVSSFSMPAPSNNLQSVSDTESMVAMNLTSIMSKYGAYSTNCGTTMIVYAKNTNYDSSVSNMTVSSSVTDFKFMKKLDVLILENLDSPLILSFSAATIPSSVTTNTTITNSTYHCKYWDEKLKMWSSNGCFVNKVSYDSIECACSHTTMFTTFLESKTTTLTVQLKDQVSSLYYAQISFGVIYLIVASAILVGLIILRKSQPVSSRLLTPYVGLIALIVECVSIYIVQRSVLVDQLNSANSQMWESGDAAANIIANIVMIIVNTLNLTAIFCYVMQVFRFQFMKLLYKKLSDNRTQAQSTTVLKALKYATSQVLFYSLIGIFAAVNVVYWIIWVILRRTEVLTSSQYTYVVSVSYTACILAFGLVITAVAILDMILSSKKEVDQKKNRRKAVNFSQPASAFSLDNADNVNEKKKINKNLFLNAFNWFTSMDGPLYFRMEMFIYIISFILLILNQVIGLSSLSYRFESLAMFKLALTFDSISFIFEVLYIISYILVFGGYALIVAIIYKVRQRRTRREEQKKQNEEIMNQELYNTLESEEGYELFANFCEKEFSSENLFLFSDIKSSPDVASGDNLGGLPFFSERIYEKYIKTGAEMEVNIPSKSRTAFVQLYEKCKKLETSTSPFDTLDSNSLAKSGIETNAVKDCFDLMMRQVVMNLGDTFSRFVFTPDYVNFKTVRDVQMQIIEKANVVYGI